MSKRKVQSIVDYWANREDECGLSVDWSEAHERCWRCGYKCALDHCHIIPDSLGGTDEPANLVLLCGRCHRDAPNVSDSQFMWLWLRAYGTTFYDSFWVLRGYDEFEKIFKRKPFAELLSKDIPYEEISTAMGEAMKSTIIHFGEGRLNPSSIAYVLYQVEKQLMNHVKGPVPQPTNLF